MKTPARGVTIPVSSAQECKGITMSAEQALRRSWVVIVLVRAAALLALFLLPFALLGAIAYWPESKYVWLWQTSLGAYLVLGCVTFFATRVSKRRHPLGSTSPSPPKGENGEMK